MCIGDCDSSSMEALIHMTRDCLSLETYIKVVVAV